jgi:hypothetical protein
MNVYRQLRILGAVAATSLAIGAQAAPISTLFGTGLDGSGNALVGGASDSDWIVVETGQAARVRTQLPGTYFANNSLSQWIWQNADGSPINVDRTFRTTFDLTGFDNTTAVINGMWGVDNIGLDILINGTSLGISLPGVVVSNFSQLHAFTINSGFIAGMNTLDFKVRDAGGVSAFRAQLSGEARLQAVPTPATLALVSLALALMVLRPRSRA